MNGINATEALRKQDVILVDVRRHADELIPGALRISVDDLRHRVDELPRGRPIVTFCA